AALATFLDQAYSCHAWLVAWEARSHGIEQAAVDLEDDLQVPWEQQLEPCQWPFFERLGKQGMIRVGEGPLDEIPSLVPAEVRFVKQNTHELGDSHCRVRVVEL